MNISWTNDEQTLILLKRFSRNPDIEKAQDETHHEAFGGVESLLGR
jgi:hypothetical protein